MNAVYIIGDTHTVNAFRVCGIEGYAADSQTAPGILKGLLTRDDAPVILITRDCAADLPDIIRNINLQSAERVILEIPGIDDLRGPGRSLTSYITEALGVAL